MSIKVVAARTPETHRTRTGGGHTKYSITIVMIQLPQVEQILADHLRTPGSTHTYVAEQISVAVGRMVTLYLRLSSNSDKWEWSHPNKSKSRERLRCSWHLMHL